MRKFLIVSTWETEIIEAEDWDDAIYKAQHGYGNSLISITLLSQEDD